MTALPLRAADPALLERLTSALGAEGVRPVEPRYLEEPRDRYRGQAAAVLRPVSVEQVAAAVALCAQDRVGLVPYGGGTGLVGGQTVPEGPAPLILSLERMRRIRALELSDNVLVAEAGVVLTEVQEAADAAGRLFPLALASQGSARIGGLMATNAGGISVLRYGNARDLCLGVEAVMADGTVIHGLSPLVKDNMGYDLRHLLIGSEGTLGIITAASLRLFPRPAELATAWLSVPSPAAALEVLQTLREGVGATISAFELIHRQGLAFLAEKMPSVPLPLRDPPAWMVLVEVADGAGSRIAERFEAALVAALESGAAQDALIAQNEAQRAAFWSVRESIPEANRLVGAIASHDISLPPSRLADFVARVEPALAAIDPALRSNCFGHLGDGNLHYNVFPPAGGQRRDYDGIRAAVTDAVHALAHALGGSVGAEHGVGRLKSADLLRYGDPGKVAAMRAIKAALDPHGILNPGAVLSRA